MTAGTQAAAGCPQSLVPAAGCSPALSTTWLWSTAGGETAAVGMRSRQTTPAWARFYRAGVALGEAPECRHTVPLSALALLIDSKKEGRVGMWPPRHHEWGTDVLHYPIKRDFIQAGTATVLQSLAPQPQALPSSEMNPMSAWSHVLFLWVTQTRQLVFSLVLLSLRETPGPASLQMQDAQWALCCSWVM